MIEKATMMAERATVGESHREMTGAVTNPGTMHRRPSASTPLIPRSPLAALSMWALLAPVFGVLFGIGLLGERPSLRETIGLTIVVAAVAAVQARQHRHQPPIQGATAAARPLHHQGDGHDQASTPTPMPGRMGPR